MSKKLSQEEFISHARLVHGNIYDYSNSIYNGMGNKLIITCEIHGDFMQTPSHHIHGKTKCKKCSKNIKSHNDFIEMSIKAHCDKYNYSKIEYKTMASKLIIICPIHGEFIQMAGNHAKGCGCFKCAKTYPMTTNSFIKKAENIHGDTYIYTNSIFNKKEKLEIVCKKHGSFYQTPNNHLKGHGCPSCSNMRSKMEIKWIDSLQNPNIKKQISLPVINGKTIIADGYDQTTNTIYEFWGDFWHGNPKTMPQNDINPRTKMTFKEHYTLTLNKIELIKKSGYNLIEMWEGDFMQCQDE